MDRPLYSCVSHCKLAHKCAPLIFLNLMFQLNVHDARIVQIVDSVCTTLNSSCVLNQIIWLKS